MKITLLLICATVLLCGCENKERSKKPEIPDDVNVDLNEDGVTDFVISYSTLSTMDIPSTHQSITGHIKPINKTELLYYKGNGFLFLEPNDTLALWNTEKQIWYHHEANIIGINAHQNIWDKHWNIVSKKKDTYYLGIKLNVDEQTLLGWLCLDLNTEDGTIKINSSQILKTQELCIKPPKVSLSDPQRAIGFQLSVK